MPLTNTSEWLLVCSKSLFIILPFYENISSCQGVEEQRRQKEEEDKKAKAKAQEDAVPETKSISVVGDQPNAPQPKAQFVVPLSGRSYILCSAVPVW